MAIFTGIVSKLIGSAGALTFRKSGGKTVVSEKVTRTANRRTPRQQRVRMRWANMVRMYKCVHQALTDCFETRPAGLSEFNMFNRVNSSMLPVYMTRSEVAGGGCVAAPYQVSQGSLPSVGITLAGTSAVTDIALGALQIDANTTVAALSNAIVRNNPDFNYGDSITFVSVRQGINAVTGIPYCSARSWTVALDKSSTVLLWSLCGREGFASLDGCLARHTAEAESINAKYAGCLFTWIHSRRSSGKTQVSTQLLTGQNTLLEDYTGNDAYLRAVATYGGESRADMGSSNFDDDSWECDYDYASSASQNSDGGSNNASNSGSGTGTAGSYGSSSSGTNSTSRPNPFEDE